MATAANTTRSIVLDEPAHLGRRIVAIIPGLLLLTAVGYAGKFIEQSIAAYTKSHHITFPNIEYVLWAIVIGLLISNTVGVPRDLPAGVATYEFWLKAGIVLLGARFLLGDILHLGGISPLAGRHRPDAVTHLHAHPRPHLQTQTQAHLPARRRLLHLRSLRHHRRQAAIDADDEDASYAIAAILALGAISLFTFPLIGHALHLSDTAYGIWAGLAVDNTAEATAAGALYSDAAGKVAVLAKTTRNALIGFVVLGYAIYWASRGQAQTSSATKPSSSGRNSQNSFSDFYSSRCSPHSAPSPSRNSQASQTCPAGPSY